MKLPRFLLTIVSITLFSLLYVYQQTEIFRLAYEGQNKISRLDDLLDKNTILRYNIETNTSLISIGDKVANNTDFEMPDAYRLVKLIRPLEGLKISQYISKKETLLSRIFGIKRQAEAKTISPSILKSSSRLMENIPANR